MHHESWCALSGGTSWSDACTCLPKEADFRAQVKRLSAELAAKDAEIERYKQTILWALGEVGEFPPNPASADAKGIQRRPYYWRTELRERAFGKNPTPPHTDTARLDKLPACFHMLRYRHPPGAIQGWWWLTYAPNHEYSDVRMAIDAHQEPKP